MSKKDLDNLTLESYENEFSFKENRSNLNISFNRIAFIFFIFLMICTIYSIKIFYLGSLNLKNPNKEIFVTKSNFRADILDSKGNFVAKTINTLTVGINPASIIDKKKLLINLKLIFPNKDVELIKNKIEKKNIFDLKKNLNKIKLKNYVD